MNKEIEIPKGYEARIEGNKVILAPKESEDERIREKLIEIVSAWKNREPHGLGNVKYISSSKRDKINKILDWLEKQKEQKPIMFQWTGKNLKEVIDFTGKSPKFGEWFKSWEDFENYVHNHDDILKLFCEDGSHYEVPVGAWIVKTPDGYNIPSRFRFVQKPAEWSEEDEENIEKLDGFLSEVFCYGHVYISQKDKEKLQTWLKSLKDRRNFPKSNTNSPSWKPSEEQMESLMRTITWLVEKGNHTDSSTLADLRSNLQKLI